LVSARDAGLVFSAAKHQIERADDDAQEVVEVVGDAAGQLPDRLHLLGLDQARLRAFAFGDLGSQPIVRRCKVSGPIRHFLLERFGEVAKLPLGSLTLIEIFGGEELASAGASCRSHRAHQRCWMERPFEHRYIHDRFDGLGAFPSTAAADEQDERKV